MKQMKVVLVCTTDDPTDSLEHHAAVAADEGFDIQVLPAWRPDKGMAVEDPEVFNGWADKLGAAADVDIRDFVTYMEALRKRHEYFRRLLCNILGSDISRGLIPSDYGLGGAMVRDICYSNAARYFGFDLPTV